MTERNLRRLAQTVAVMDWSDLIAHLATLPLIATLPLNEVALPLQSTETFNLLARPTALQKKPSHLLGLLLPRVQ
jgi:hypothetical protein